MLPLAHCQFSPALLPPLLLPSRCSAGARQKRGNTRDTMRTLGTGPSGWTRLGKANRSLSTLIPAELSVR